MIFILFDICGMPFEVSCNDFFEFIKKGKYRIVDKSNMLFIYNYDNGYTLVGIIRFGGLYE